MTRIIAALLTALALPALAQDTGVIFGTVTLNGAPAANQAILLQRQRDPENHLSVNATTDEHGAFRFEGLAPGFYTVATLEQFEQRRNRTHSPFQTTNHQAHVYLDPGESQEVAVGGKGRTILGKVNIPEGDADRIAFLGGDQRRIGTPYPTPEIPDGLTEEEANARRDAFYASDAFHAAYDKCTRIVLTLSADGTFTAHDVPPGDYEGFIEIMGHTGDRPIGTVKLAFTVPEGDYNSNVDLGAFDIQLFPESAPPSVK